MSLFRWETINWDEQDRKVTVLDMKAAAAEFIAMTLFVIVGCGTACDYGASDGETRLCVAFAFGMAILVLVYAICHLSGGHINGAVTFSLVLGGALPWQQGLLHLFMQLVGSVVGAGVLAVSFPCGQDMTTNLGSNIVNPAFGQVRALIVEIIGTFILCIVVWEAAVSPISRAGPNAAIAIGFAVFITHLFMLPIDGCSINPTRSFGPAVVSNFRSCGANPSGGLEDLWVMWLGPLIGAALASGLKRIFVPKDLKKKDDPEVGAAAPAVSSALSDPRGAE